MPAFSGLPQCRFRACFRWCSSYLCEGEGTTADSPTHPCHMCKHDEWDRMAAGRLPSNLSPLAAPVCTSVAACCSGSRAAASCLPACLSCSLGWVRLHELNAALLHSDGLPLCMHANGSFHQLSAMARPGARLGQPSLPPPTGDSASLSSLACWSVATARTTRRGWEAASSKRGLGPKPAAPWLPGGSTLSLVSHLPRCPKLAPHPSAQP